MVHVWTSRTSRREWENLVRARNNSSPWNLICWRLARVADESKSMVRLLHSTNNKEKHTSRGQYKAQVLSKYHRPTQNREQYISNNNIKSTTILNSWQPTNTWTIDNNTIIGTPSITILSTPIRTQASTPYSFGNSFFDFGYINIIQDYFSLLLSCRNVTLRSPNATVSERDTPIP